jgi:hypothetical protein
MGAERDVPERMYAASNARDVEAVLALIRAVRVEGQPG